ncbi:hypothetical protein WICPIJ_005752 [Wickerhamomyces pijperi]|uniref:Uncharacterized protein n=1 Tax=Wickerhamomyces pijperi TaxID=599730 RepID=A0A9P8TKU2_WICPI|nr:hypothetical protein WICPIJ_005752 [Wickerhamomyces pijperi]
MSSNETMIWDNTCFFNWHSSSKESTLLNRFLREFEFLAPAYEIMTILQYTWYRSLEDWTSKSSNSLNSRSVEELGKKTWSSPILSERDKKPEFSKSLMNKEICSPYLLWFLLMKSCRYGPENFLDFSSEKPNVVLMKAKK